MRPDMSHVIVERPRRGVSWARKGRVLPPDDLPSHEGMRRAHRRGRKSLNENLNPLKRFLEKQVGRPWDVVYAEIARHLRADSTVQQHVRDHLEDYVALRPLRSGRRWRSVRRPWPWRERLYVDPQDGILKRTAELPEVRTALQAAKKKPDATPDRISLGAEAELRRIDGLWYEIRLAPLPEPHYVAVSTRTSIPGWRASAPVVIAARRLTTPPVQDAVSRALIPVGPACDEPEAWRVYHAHHPDRRYAVAKRRLSRAELRRHRLEDQLPAV